MRTVSLSDKSMDDQSKIVHAVILLDASGSMASIKDDVVGGIDAFIQEQKAQPGECLLTIIDFDSGKPFNIVFAAKPVREIEGFTSNDFTPRGGTPLLDAMGHLFSYVDQVDEGYTNLVMVFTDGHENSSREWTNDGVAKLTKEKTDAGWQFVYLGANQDAFAVGGGMGFGARNAGNYNTAHTSSVMANMSTYTSSLRSAAAGGQTFRPWSDVIEDPNVVQDASLQSS